MARATEELFASARPGRMGRPSGSEATGQDGNEGGGAGFAVAPGGAAGG
jgi:hypothetical protein